MWDFIQNQLLGMRWLSELIAAALSGLGLDTSTRIGGSVQFFLYDTVKITVLLCVLIFIISYIQSYFPPERSRKIMVRFHGVGANLVGALLGTVSSMMTRRALTPDWRITGASATCGTISFWRAGRIPILSSDAAITERSLF